MNSNTDYTFSSHYEHELKTAKERKLQNDASVMLEKLIAENKQWKEEQERQKQLLIKELRDILSPNARQQLNNTINQFFKVPTPSNMNPPIPTDVDAKVLQVSAWLKQEAPEFKLQSNITHSLASNAVIIPFGFSSINNYGNLTFVAPKKATNQHWHFEKCYITPIGTLQSWNNYQDYMKEFTMMFLFEDVVEDNEQFFPVGFLFGEPDILYTVK